MKTGKSYILTGLYNRQPSNGLNDPIVDEKGRIYFTDSRHLGWESMNQPHQAVYRLAPDGRVTRLITDAGKPNGVQVSPDQKTRTGVVARETHTSWPPASPESTGAVAAPVDGERGPARERYASSGPDEKTR